MQLIDWSTSTSTVGSKNAPGTSARLPPTSARAPFASASDTCRSTMASCASLESDPTSASKRLPAARWRRPRTRSGHQLDELVVDGLLDEDALDRGARLAAVEHGAPDRGVRRPLEIGVGEHDHRVLAAELEAVRDQPLGGALGDLPAGARGAGELDEVGLVHQRGAGRSGAGQALEHSRSAHVLAPAAHDLARWPAG